MVMYGHAWLCIVMYGREWSCMVMYGHVWSSMVMEMVIHGFVEQQMEFWDYRKYGEYR